MLFLPLVILLGETAHRGVPVPPKIAIRAASVAEAEQRVEDAAASVTGFVRRALLGKPDWQSILHEDYSVPLLFLQSMSESMMERMVRKLREVEARSGRAGVSGRALFVHPQNGLGNRMRVVGSAMGYAQVHEPRVVVVLWERDRHMDASFFDLFQDVNDLVVVDVLAENWAFWTAREKDEAWKSVALYNYMPEEPESKRGQQVVDDREKHIYFRSTEIIVDDNFRRIQNAGNIAVRSLLPVQEVLKSVNSFGPTNDTIGVHIRSLELHEEFPGDQGFQVDKEYGAQAKEKMSFWRKHCNAKNFIDEMKTHVAEDQSVQFYVAADSQEAIREIERAFPGRVSHMLAAGGTDCRSRRDVECNRRALVDLLVLSRSKMLLGSHWSSFTSTVISLGVKKWRRAGLEFAVPPKP